jgi:hypothetical protein
LMLPSPASAMVVKYGGRFALYARKKRKREKTRELGLWYKELKIWQQKPSLDGKS